MGKLTKGALQKATKLTSHLSLPFTLCFKYKLQNGYTFNDLNTAQIRDLQKFLDIVSQLTSQQVKQRYERESDPNDTFNGNQVTHYGITQVFHIHGTIENGQFVVLRLDPRHHVNKESYDMRPPPSGVAVFSGKSQSSKSPLKQKSQNYSTIRLTT